VLPKGRWSVIHPHLSGLWEHAEFRKLWAAQTVSFVGSQVTLLALPLAAVLTLHASSAQMGLLRAVSLAPTLLGLVAGVWVDRVHRRPILILADLGRAVLLGTIPLAAFAGSLSIGHLYLVAVLTGILTTFFDVAQASLLPMLVARERLVEGNSKLEVSRSMAMIVGPGLAGPLVQLMTAPIAIGVDALSFLGSAVFLALMRTPEPAPTPPEEQSSLWSDMADGLRMVWQHPLLRSMALSLSVYNFFSSLIAAVYVLYVVGQLKLPPTVVGLIYILGSVSFLIGATGAQRVARRFGVGPTIVWGAGVSDAGALLIPLASGSAVTTVLLLIAAQCVATLAGPITAITQLSLRQTATPDRLQGRVNGAMQAIALGMSPAGALAGGAFGGVLGLHATMLIGAIGMQAGFLILLLSPLRRLASSQPTEPA